VDLTPARLLDRMIQVEKAYREVQGDTPDG